MECAETVESRVAKSVRNKAKMAIKRRKKYKKIYSKVWGQETVRSSRTTRTKIPLKSLISEGFSYSLSIAAQEVSLSFLTHLFDKRRLNIVIFAELQYN